jgi:drug/metabolite transporter (DMT)-like permease
MPLLGFLRPLAHGGESLTYPRHVLTVLLSLGTSACYGLSNFLGPQLARRDSIVAVLFISQLAALAGCALYVVGDGAAALDAEATMWAAIAGIGNALGLIGFYKAAELGPLSIVAPIGATGAAVPVIWGLTHGDDLTALQAPGVLLALVGCVLASRHPEGSHHRYKDPRASAFFAVASALWFGVFLTALPEAADDSRSWALFDARLVLLVIITIWAGRKLRQVRLSRRAAVNTIPGLLLLAGTLLYAAAAARGQLALVSVLSTLFPIVTTGLGIMVLDERPSPLQSIGIVAAMAGVILIAV